MSKTVKKIIAGTVALLIAFVFLAAGSRQSSVSVANAAAAEDIVDTKVVNRVAYGKTFTVGDGKAGVTVTVKSPSGTTVEVGTDKTVKATQVGVYEVTYNSTDGGKYASYTYRVECYMDYEYKLVVDGNGGAIPTFRKVGDAFKLPSATLYYLDEDVNGYLPSTASDTDAVQCRVTAPNGTSTVYTKTQLEASNGVSVDAASAGTYFITYFANVQGGDNIKSAEYTVQVQNTFSDTENPKVTINGVVRNYSTCTQVKVPTASVSDNFDGNRVATEITVMHDYGNGLVNVPEAVVDKNTGYALVENGKPVFYKKGETTRYAYGEDGERETTTVLAEAASALFDNDTFMTFYPTEDGSYKVTYTAKDSSGNAAVPYSYSITVSDTTAPTVKELDSSLIPSVWGRNVYALDTEAAEENKTKAVSSDIQFPMPVLTDNSGNDNLSVRFKLTRSQNSNTVLSFGNIYGTEPSADNRVAGSVTFGFSDRTYYFFRYWESKTAYTVDETTGKISGGDIGDNAYSLIYYDSAAQAVTKGFFNFSMLPETSEYLGSYSVEYTMRDAKNNNTSRTYNLTLNSVFTDTSLPVVMFDTPEYFIFRDYESTQSVTNVRATDAEDTRLGVEYYLIVNQSLTQTDDDGKLDFGANITVENVADWKESGDLIELSSSLGSNALTLEVTEDGDYEITATNKEGVEQTATVTAANLGNAYLALRATDAAGNSAYLVKAVPVIDGTKGDSKSYTPAFGAINTADGKVNEQYNFGSFTVPYASYEDRNYTGFELYVQRIKNDKGQDVDESPLTSVSFETYSDNRSSGTNKIHVDNIRFTPTKAGTYMIVARGFHVSGVSNVKMKFVTVTGNSSSSTETSALGTNLDYNKTYTLDNYDMPSDWANGGVLRSITGGRCTLMGTEFTAKSNTNYTFENYVFEYAASGDNLATYRYADNTTGVKAAQLAKDKPGAKNEALIAGESRATETFTSSFSDTNVATFQLVGSPMPTYSEKDAYLVLPNISASSANGNATKIVLTVTDPDGNVSTSGNTNTGSYVEIFDAESDLPADYTGGALVGNQFMFRVTDDGTYTLNYTATLNNQTASVEYTVKVGDVVAPTFTVGGIGIINNKNVAIDSVPTASVNDTFGFAAITLKDEPSSSTCTYSKVLYDPSNNAVLTVNHISRPYNGTEPYKFTTAGKYRVVYTVTDEAGNASSVDYYITVTSSGSGSISTASTATLAVVLIIVGVLVIAGVIIYLIRFRKRKSAK